MSLSCPSPENGAQANFSPPRHPDTFIGFPFTPLPGFLSGHLSPRPCSPPSRICEYVTFAMVDPQLTDELQPPRILTASFALPQSITAVCFCFFLFPFLPQSFP